MSTQISLQDIETLIEPASYKTTNIKVIPVSNSTRKPNIDVLDGSPQETDIWSNSQSYSSTQTSHQRNLSYNQTPDKEIQIKPDEDNAIIQQEPQINKQEDNLDFEYSDFYDLEATDAQGNLIPFSSLKGKLVLITNIATQCVSAYQIGQLQTLYGEYKDRGLVLLGFPSNQFFQERASSNEKVVTKCSLKYNATFPIMEKIRVNGKDQHQVFRYLKGKKKGFLHSTAVKWNFEKFLIDRDGFVIKRYSTLQKKKHIVKDIELYLQQEQHQEQE